MSRREPYQFQPPPADAPEYWRSLEERANHSPEFQEKLAAEFPAGASELNDPVTRRSFLTLMGASIALAGLEGCARRPVDPIVPYTRPPDSTNPGVPEYFATSIDRRGDALGLVVECYEYRPTKIEGNPDHPASHGRADLIAQASILDLYDPDRSRQPMHRGQDKTFRDFEIALEEKLATLGEGRTLRILAQPTNSPTFLRLRNLVLQRFPEARFHTYSPINDSNARAGAMLAFGRPLQVLPDFERARVILSLDSDFLLTEPGNVRANLGFTNGRRVRRATDTMNRLYVVESTYTVTGSNADHRLRLPARDIETYLLALAAELAANHGVDLGEIAAAAQSAPRLEGVPAHWISAVARDLAANRGASAVVVGTAQPARVHSLALAINHGLGNLGRTVRLYPVADPDEPDQNADIRALADALRTPGQVDTLLILGGNPVYDAPADLDFGRLLAQVPTSFHLSDHRDETSVRCTWHAPRAHEYESWGDHRGLDNSVALQQPLIAPLYNGHSDIEVLAILAGLPERRGLHLVRQTFDQLTGGGDRAWRRALHAGVAVAPPPPEAITDAPRRAEIAAQLRAREAPRPLGQNNLEAVFLVDPKMEDGRHANNAWLLEMPEPMSKITWDNAAYFSPATARALGIQSGDMVRLSRQGGGSVEIVAWVMPGHADWSIGLPLGWGRTHAGRLGNNRGFNVYPLRPSTATRFVDGVTVTPLGRRYAISQTQEHNTMEGRPVAIEGTLSQYRQQPNFAAHRQPTPRTLPLWREVDYRGRHKWGMVIDLTTCTGCNACVIACQSENNVPVVGKDQVARGREMHWLQIDRYFSGSAEDPQTVHQPRMCVHCEEAPCENVCPVNATSHSPEGLNEMTYNRCIGTRYCANNCPYKVRRFNYLNWHNDGVWDHRQLPEQLRMQHNPNVTVRFRGVMEKCTYCVQRIQSVKIAAHRDNRRIRDGEITPACAQTCPGNAIVFGDLNDPQSAVAQADRAAQRYKLLADIGTQPRTTYLAQLRNPNPDMPTPRSTTETHG